jgi:hypothetical protein
MPSSIPTAAVWRTLLIAALCGACGGPMQEPEHDAAAAGAPELAAAVFEPEDPLPAAGFLRSSYSFEIKSGHHKSDHDFVARPHLGRHVDRALRFRATFASDAAYTTQAASNQSDWNKLMGISTDRIHKNSIRIGWRWNPATSRVELGFYGYLNGTRLSQQLAEVALGQPIDCELHMTNLGLTASAGGHSHTESGSLGVSLPLTWVLHSAYFGGAETAPHDLHVTVTDISAQ